MNTIFRVAKTELRTLFYSPIAWFLLIVFMIQCAMVYASLLGSIAKIQELGAGGARVMSALTSKIFLDPGGLFGNVMQNLYLYIPLLTMGLISRETGSGTIKLLYSSPVKVREIVFGKFLAMLLYSLVLVGVVAVFVVSGLFQIESPDTGMLMTALLGFFLLLCTYASIGLFMSSLTTYQVVAALSTFVMIGVLSYIGTVWQDVEVVRELTYFLSINGRTQKMLGGLITTKDLLYFILIVYIFLGLTIYKLKAGMESKPLPVRLGRYVGVVASALLIGYVSTRPGLIGYYDATANKSRTLTPQVQQIIAELGDEPLEITAYNNLLGRYWSLGSPTSYNQNVSRWEPYMRFKPNIKLNTAYYYDTALDNSLTMFSSKGKTLKETAENYAKTMDLNFKMFKSPEEMRAILDLRPELNRYVMQLKWKDRTTFLRVFNDQQVWPGETEVAAALKRLLQAKLPKIAFLTGDLERDIHKNGDKQYQTLTNLSTFRHALVNQGFDVDTVSLETQEIPSDISTLVLADPKIELTSVTLEKLQKYIAGGGNMLITTEPGRQSIINPLLNQLGIQLMDGMIVQASKDHSPDLVAPILTNFGGELSKTLKRSAADSAKVSMPGVSGLAVLPGTPFEAKPLLLTDRAVTWNKMKQLDLSLVTSAAVSGRPTAVKPVAVEDEEKDNTTEPVKRATVKSNTLDKPITVGAPAATVSKGVVRMDSVSGDHAASGAEPVEGERKIVRLSTNGERRQLVRRDSANSSGVSTVKAGEMKITRIEVTPGKDNVLKQAVPGKRNDAPVKVVAAAPKPGVDKPLVPAEGEDQATKRRRALEAGTVLFTPAEGDVKASFPTAVSLTRQIAGKEQRIIVAGDADFMSNSELQRANLRTVNFTFNTGVFSWLSNGEFPIDASRPPPKDNKLKLDTEEVKVLRILYIWILPGLLFAFGSILLIRRKRK